MCDSRRQLAQAHATMSPHFPYRGPWWPGTPWEITVNAVLVTLCDWSKARDAVLRLRDAGLLPIAVLASTDPAKVQAHLGMWRAEKKARYLVRLAQGLLARGFSDIESFLANPDTQAVRQELDSFDGIGSETADSICLFASDRHPCFIADDSARRALRRLGLFAGEVSNWDDYENVKAVVEPHIRADLSLYRHFAFPDDVPPLTALLRDLHALFVELGRHHCLKSTPRCEGRGGPGWDGYEPCLDHCQEGACRRCPLRDLCPHEPSATRLAPATRPARKNTRREA